ncbi:probable chitinase 10 [Limulus polyphemus]|uniref:Probable chitinase 10 n=1 Tax=Limulus polyphemus TaxID=6850 RepID=A0ABM1BJR8_LIMPO|nr:probable chitinase 10 [Limulus polyphemus]
MWCGSTASNCSGNRQLKVVCYFSNWAWYRSNEGQFLPENIDPNLCTHLIYAFATLDSSSLTLGVCDSWADIDNNFYKRVVQLKNKNPQLRVLLALGGWNDSGADKYSRLVSSPKSRRNFIQHVVPFLKKYNFDGLDLDWEYPVCWQGRRSSGHTTDRPNFANFVLELRQAFDQEQSPLLLTAAVSGTKCIIDDAYEVSTLSADLDFINIMAYDYHGSWENHTGHVAPLYPQDGDPNTDFNAKSSLEYWVEKGAPKHKLVLGTPFYGRSFTLSDPNNNGIRAPVIGGGIAGPLTKEVGMLAYYEVCKKIKLEAWTKVRDPSQAIGPYAYRGDQWVGYDDPASLSRKARFVREEGYGGVMVWTVDFDDFRGMWNKVAFPLLRALHFGLFGTGDPPEK